MLAARGETSLIPTETSSGRTVGSIVRSTQGTKRNRITADEGFLFRPGPAFQLGFASPGFGESGKQFHVEEGDGRVEPRGSTAAASGMVGEPLFRICRAADIERTGSETEKVDRCWHTRRNAKSLTELKVAIPPIVGPKEAAPSTRAFRLSLKACGRRP